MNQLSPRAARSLRARRNPLAETQTQLALLDSVALPGGDFEAALRAHGVDGLRADRIRVLQLNLGKLCNMACRHCHVDAGPDRIAENMSPETAQACIEAIDRLRPEVVDLTGGAPELNPSFELLVRACSARGIEVLDRCNLSVLLLARSAHLPEFLAEQGVHVVASLPHPRARSTDAQRGDGAFKRSIEALLRLNAVGYGAGDPRRQLTLVHNPAGAFLAGSQASLQGDYERALARDHGVRFDRLIALNNMPIARFLEWLDDTGNLEPYLARLVKAFNPGATAGLMCRDTISIRWDGRLYDCDFNQMLAIDADVQRPHIASITREGWLGHRIRTARHCFGCTAGAGSSCAGATAT